MLVYVSVCISVIVVLLAVWMYVGSAAAYKMCVYIVSYIYSLVLYIGLVVVFAYGRHTCIVVCAILNNVNELN